MKNAVKGIAVRTTWLGLGLAVGALWLGLASLPLASLLIVSATLTFGGMFVNSFFPEVNFP